MEQLVESIGAQGLLQPLMLIKKPGEDTYDILAGHLRFEACKQLGWRTVPAIIQRSKGKDGSQPVAVDG